MKHLFPFLFLLFLAFPVVAGAEAKPFELRDSDRVVFLGNEFFDNEREQCFIETMLTTRFPDQNITFRNLGYSGDTVWADARTLCSGWDAFGPPDQGFERLTKLIGQIKPTVVFVAYGMNESFDGPAGVDRFRRGLDRMLDMLAKTGARLVLISPIRHENLGPPLPDPAAHNRDLEQYCSVISDAATRRGSVYIDLFYEMSEPANPLSQEHLTFDGIHLTPHGYQLVAGGFVRQLGWPLRTCAVTINAANGNVSASGMTIKNLRIKANEIRFSGSLQELFQSSPTVRIVNLPDGQYSLSIDAQKVATESAGKWSQWVEIRDGPDQRQAQKLRDLIKAKNFDFFNYWRPENDTYIFGYRKHEQGRNAVEVPRFEELIPAKEEQIAQLRVPVMHEYVLVQTKSP